MGNQKPFPENIFINSSKLKLLLASYKDEVSPKNK